VELEVAGVRRRFEVSRYGSVPAGGLAELVAVESSLGSVSFTPVPRFREPGSALAAGSLVAPMPGTVLRLGVAVGERVRAGQPVLWLEAMKMEHQITAPADGVLAELPVGVGQQVEVGTLLAVV